MLGYWNKTEETNKVLKNGWLYTGDIGTIDPNDGYLKITDRKKDIIVSAGGDNISPAKIENQLSNHSGIDQCLVYGDGKNYLVAIVVPSKEFVGNRNKIEEIIQEINKKVGISLECSLGFLTDNQAKRLKELGVKRYNHNLETSRSKFPEICTTHTYQDRIETLNIARNAGLELCSLFTERDFVE